MPNPQAAIFNGMGQHQWYVHLSREAGADMGGIKSALNALADTCKSKNINLVLGFGPDLLADLGGDVPSDFQKFETIVSTDGSGTEAKGTQEELLLWLNSPQKDDVWKAQYDARTALKGHMSVARETPTFIYGESMDMTGFIDGTGNPEPDEERKVALIPDGEASAGGSFSLDKQEDTIVIEGRNGFRKTKTDNKTGVSAIDSFGDHRIAMAFAIAGTAGEPGSVVRIKNFNKSVETNYSGFLEDLSIMRASKPE